MNHTGIETADFTSNPCSGCLHGCKWCYARGIVKRFHKVWGYPADDPFQPLFHPREIEKLLACEKKCTVMIGSMCDLGGKWFWKAWMPKGGKYTFKSNPLVSVTHGDLAISTVDIWRELLFVIQRKPNITFQVFTKNPENLYWSIDGALLRSESNIVPPNLWIGATVTNQADAEARIPYLLRMREIGVKTLFVSWEPVMGQVPWEWYVGEIAVDLSCPICGTTKNSTPPLEVDPGDYGPGGYAKYCMCPNNCDVNEEFTFDDYCNIPTFGIDWLIIGAMTGRLAKKNRPQREWIQSAVNQCRFSGVPVFCKSSITKLFPDTEWPKEFPE
jgi:protein gp37